MTPAVLSNPPHQSAPTVEGKHASAVLCLQLPMRPTPITLGLMLAGLAVVYLGLLLWLSGNWRWVEGWIFGVWWVSFASTILLWLHYRDPALLAERFRMPGTGGESRADVAILIGIKVCFLALIVLPALDVRFGWTPRLPLWCEVCGGILVLGGSFPFFRAFTDNTYASQLVRIQTERGQHVIDTGVYGFVRHPMYLGASLSVRWSRVTARLHFRPSLRTRHDRAARCAHLWRGEAVGTRSGGLQGISPEGALPVGTTHLVITPSTDFCSLDQAWVGSIRLTGKDGRQTAKCKDEDISHFPHRPNRRTSRVGRALRRAGQLNYRRVRDPFPPVTRYRRVTFLRAYQRKR